MSAAEKLKVLDETFKASKNQREQADYLYRMAAVFPQIVAVVEAAERVDPRKHVMDRDEERGRKWILRRALTALDRALTVDGKTSGDELRDEGIHDAFDANQWD